MGACRPFGDGILVENRLYNGFISPFRDETIAGILAEMQFSTRPVFPSHTGRIFHVGSIFCQAFVPTAQQHRFFRNINFQNFSVTQPALSLVFLLTLLFVFYSLVTAARKRRKQQEGSRKQGGYLTMAGRRKGA